MMIKEPKADAQKIFLAGLEAVQPAEVIKRKVRFIPGKNGPKLKIGAKTYSLSKYQAIYLIGAGKASAYMALALESILGEWITGGLVCVKYGHGVNLSRVRVLEGGHPIPDESGLLATREIIALLQKLHTKDLVLFLISGGASALLCLPCQGITLEDKQEISQLLLSSGATIAEINTIRKHISQVKGGKLARIAYPADMISLILSDVVGDQLDIIASGPTVPDPGTFADCLEIIKKYNLDNKIPPPIMNHLEKGIRKEVEETLKPDDPIFKFHQAVIVGNNILAIKSARLRAKDLGYNTLILSSTIQGEGREVAKVHAAIAKEILNSGNPIKKPACIISGGETTVTVKGKGRGGRNQEFVLAALIELANYKGITILSAGTDGTDGPTEAAGAIGDHTTIYRAQQLGLNPQKYLENNNSYHFFKELGDLFITGPTGTNVMDLQIILVV
jgi:hydroxypyruvate reductase